MKIINSRGRETQPHCVFNPNLVQIRQKIIECWTSKLMKIGISSVGLSKLAKLGSEQWILDPEGNQFLILVSHLTTGSDMKAFL
tara:strand:- start:206 stop:457 length:252 start_codon:yes stop_codon:yes gene_type:complete